MSTGEPVVEVAPVAVVVVEVDEIFPVVVELVPHTVGSASFAVKDFFYFF